MRGVNKVILVGNLGADPEVRATPDGTMVLNLSVATSEQWKDRNTGQEKEKTEWHRVVVFGKRAEAAQQYLQKGSKVYVEGKLTTQKWQDQNGQDRYNTSIHVSGFGHQILFLSNPAQVPASQPAAQPAQAGYQQPAHTQNGYRNQSQGTRRQPAQQPPQGGFDDFNDDIPF